MKRKKGCGVMEISKCLGCMETFRGYPCPNCGYDPKKQASVEYALPAETILAGKYLTGKVPPNAMDRVDKDSLEWDVPVLQALPAPALSTLKKAMAVTAEKRLQTMEELEKGLFGGTREKAAKPTEKGKGKNRGKVAAAIAAVAL